MRTRRPVEVRLDDPGLDGVMRAQLLEWDEMSSLMVPLVVGGEVVGSLEVSEAVYPRHFTEQEVALCVALGEQAAVAIHNAQLYRQLQEQKETIERQATVDGLTGLSNHRNFWERLRDEVARARRYGQPLSLLMLDLDDFKRVNDRFGHPVGDELLRAVGQALQTQVRQGVDCAARYGGEEFAVILPVTESESRTAPWTARCRRRSASAPRSPACAPPGRPRLARHHRQHRRGHRARARGQRRGPGREADQALYRAKARGKDTVAVYGAPGADRGALGKRGGTTPMSAASAVRACPPGSRTSRPGSRRTRGRSTASASTRSRRRRRTGRAP